MKNVLTLLKRELLAYFYSPTAYICMTISLFVWGWIYAGILKELANPLAPPQGAAMAFFFAPVLFLWALPICPALTMRLFAEERRTGTIEILMTAPLTEWQAVTAKFLSAFIFYGILWAPTLIYVLILSRLADPDPGPIIAGYIGAMLVGGLFLSVGTLTSSFTQNQIVAYMTAFVINLTLMIAGIFTLATENPKLRSLIGYVNIYEHLQNFSRGIIETKNLVYYISLTIFVLFLAVRVVEARKWR